MRSARWLLLVVLLFSPQASGQETARVTEVRVRDGSGSPVGGALVEAIRIQPPSAQKAASCTTTSAGRCLLPLLPPGEHSLSVTAVTAPNRKMADGSLFEVPAGARATLDVVLDAGTTAGVRVVVSGDGDESAWTAFEREDFEIMPAGWGLLRSLRIGTTAESPGSGPVQLHAPPAEYAVFLDGVESSAAGVAEILFPAAFVDVARVRSSAGSASVDRGPAGAIHVVSRSGGATWRGQASVSIEGDRLTGAPRSYSRYSPWDPSLAESGLTVRKTPWVSFDPAFDIGGPALPSSLWVYGGVAYRRRANHRDVVFVEDPFREKRRFSWFTWSAQATANLTAALTGGLRTRAAATFGRSANRGGAPALEPEQGRLPDGTPSAGFTRASFGDPDTAVSRWRDTGANARKLAVSWAIDWQASPSTIVSADASYSPSNRWTPEAFRGTETRRVFGTSNAGVAQSGVHPAGYADNESSYGTLRDAYARAALQVAGAWLPPRSRHGLELGFRFERLANDVYIGHVRPTITLYWNRARKTLDGREERGTCGYYSVSRNGTIGNAAGNTLAVWLQDRWAVHDRLGVEAGLRAERERVASYARGSDVVRPVFGFRDKLAPRASVAWRMDEQGKWRADASFGFFYDHLRTELARAHLGGQHDVTEYWTLDTLDWQRLECDEGWTACQGRFIERVDERPALNLIDPVLSTHFGRPMARMDPGLRPMRTGEFDAGVERQLPGRFSVGLRYYRKWLSRAVEDIGLSLPGGYDPGYVTILGNPGEGYGRNVSPALPSFPLPEAVRNYDALELRARKRLARGWSLDARYRWSRLAGNYEGTAVSEGSGRESANDTKAFDSPFSSYDSAGNTVLGRLPADRPHRLSVSGTYELPFGASVAIAGVVQSGRTETSEIDFNGYPVLFNGRGDLGRQPVLSQLDLQVRQEFQLGARRRVILEAAIENVFDQGAAIAYFSNNPYRDGFELPDAAFAQTPWDPARWAEALRESGVRVRDQLLFRVPNRFQAPRQATLGVRVSF